jgi:hypothetical protein
VFSVAVSLPACWLDSWDFSAKKSRASVATNSVGGGIRRVIFSFQVWFGKTGLEMFCRQVLRKVRMVTVRNVLCSKTAKEFAHGSSLHISPCSSRFKDFSC